MKIFFFQLYAIFELGVIEWDECSRQGLYQGYQVCWGTVFRRGIPAELVQAVYEPSAKNEIKRDIISGFPFLIEYHFFSVVCDKYVKRCKIEVSAGQ